MHMVTTRKALATLSIGLCFSLIGKQSSNFDELLSTGNPEMKAATLVGGQWGDEGKGKVIDLLAGEVDIVVRAQGGANAGHTVIVGDKEYKFHLIPSGILYPNCTCYIAGGTVVDPQVLLQEIESLEKSGIDVKGRLFISLNASIIMPYHKAIDKIAEESKGSNAIGTTGRGIGPCYADKTNRIGIKLFDMLDSERLYNKIKFATEAANQNPKFKSLNISVDEIHKQYIEYAQKLMPYIKLNMELDITQQILKGKRVLIEGAQGTLLDVTFGTTPFVTSSSTTAAGICAGAGVGVTTIGTTIIVLKAYVTRVGHGPFPTEVPYEQSFIDHVVDREYGTTTGRRRRAGWFDAVIGKASVELNGANCIALTKLDVLDKVEKIKICVAYNFKDAQYSDLLLSLDKAEPVYEEMDGWLESTSNIKKYEDLPVNARKYIDRIGELCGAKVKVVSVGPERTQTIMVP